MLWVLRAGVLACIRETFEVPPSSLKFETSCCTSYQYIARQTIRTTGWVVTWFLLGYTVRIFEYTTDILYNRYWENASSNWASPARFGTTGV